MSKQICAKQTPPSTINKNTLESVFSFFKYLIHKLKKRLPRPYDWQPDLMSLGSFRFTPIGAMRDLSQEWLTVSVT